jgi:replication initiation protein RepC
LETLCSLRSSTVRRITMDADCRLSTHARGSATGLRKLTPPMLGTIKAAEAYSFSAEMLPGQALAAFKAAAPYLGLRANVVHAVDWLFRFTDPIDWQPSSRPIVWPSAAMQQLHMGLGVSQVKNLNRHLVELGLVVMRDSPNGKRYGRRGPQGRIVEAYGFDLSPIASRFAEFQAIAQAGREERARIATLRRRATIARNGIRQLLETADEQRIGSDEWEACRRTAATASRGLAGRKNADDMEMAVATLERVQSEMRLHLETALAALAELQPSTVSSSVDTDPKGPYDWPHITTTNQLINPKDTVIASGKKEPPQGPHTRTVRPFEVLAKKAVPFGRSPTAKPPTERSDFGAVLKLTPNELTRLAPRLASYLRNSSPRWPEIVEAAEWLRDEMGIPQFIWGDACLALGREQAAAAVAIVSAKPQTHFRRSAGAYFHGMISRAKAGELHLTRTIWAMRNQGER